MHINTSVLLRATFLIVLVLTISLADSGAVTAETENVKLATGISTEQLQALLGIPDRVTKKEKDTEFWYYGDSFVVINNQIVGAIVDNGTLSKRTVKPKQAKVTQKKSTDAPPWEKEWFKPWRKKFRYHLILR